MSDETANGVPLNEGTTPNPLTSPDQASCIAGNCVTNLVSQKRKCRRKGRRRSGTKKHRAGRNRNRKYKPYHKLTISEREKVDARIERRSKRMRAHLQSAGISLAPHNTTQFLLDDRAEGDLLLRRIKGNGHNFDDNSDQSSMSDHDSSSSETDEFSEMWRTENYQRFQAMSDQQLRECYINLEDMIEEEERKREECMTKVRIFQEEIRKYEATNEVLFKVNAGLAKVLQDMQSKPENEVDKKILLLENDSSADKM